MNYIKVEYNRCYTVGNDRTELVPMSIKLPYVEQEQANDFITLSLTKETLQDIVRICQNQGMNISLEETE